LKTNDEVPSKFTEFKALVENKTGRKIKVLPSDNGREYTTMKFDSLCWEVGIKRELTVPYNPQQNGVVENTGTSNPNRAPFQPEKTNEFLW